MEKPIAQYVQAILNGHKGKPSVLLVDEETTGVISLCTTQSEILKHDIYLVDKISNTERQKMRHMDCICFLRPSNSSVEMLLDELKEPKYASYKLFFNNVLRKSQIERLAEADDNEVVTNLTEMFLDYNCLNTDFFVSGVNGVLESSFSGWRDDDLERSADSLVALLATVGLDANIRYESNSRLTKQLANEVQRVLTKEKLIPANSSSTTLLILDRASDPITALLTHWTYQAMIDELIGLKNNRVSLENSPGVEKDMQNVVLDPKEDDFFRKAMYLNFGDLGISVKEYVGQFQAKTKSNANFESVAEMKKFVENYPGYRKLSGNVAKHVTLVGELSRRIEATNLLEVSELEQSFACSDSHMQDYESLLALLQPSQQQPIDTFSRYRLIALYALRYKQHSGNKIRELLAMVDASNFGDQSLSVAVTNLLRVYQGTDLFSDSHSSSGIDSFFTRAQAGLKGLKSIENVYTQYKSRLYSLVNSLSKGTLSYERFPSLKRSTDRLPQQTCIIYIVGGVTYEEAQIIGLLNSQNQNQGGLNVILGGTSTISKNEALQSFSFV